MEQYSFFISTTTGGSEQAQQLTRGLQVSLKDSPSFAPQVASLKQHIHSKRGRGFIHIHNSTGHLLKKCDLEPTSTFITWHRVAESYILHPLALFSPVFNHPCRTVTDLQILTCEYCYVGCCLTGGERKHQKGREERTATETTQV